jgi:hypothetical protein
MSGRAKLPQLEKFEAAAMETVRGLDNRQLHILVAECELASDDNCSFLVYQLSETIGIIAQLEILQRDKRRSSPPLPLVFNGKPVS